MTNTETMVHEVREAGPGAAPGLDPTSTLDQATLPVRTEVLERHGIDRLRVVSVSRFLEIVEKLAAATRPSADPAPSDAPPDGGTALGPGDPEVQEAWTSLRATCMERLHRVEALGARVGGSLAEIERQLERYGSGNPDRPPTVTAGPAPDSVLARRLTLLREMFREDLGYEG